MILKDREGVAADIDRLEALLNHPGADRRSRLEIEDQIRRLKAGDRGERDAAYHMRVYFGDNPNWVVINDLRLEHDGLVAQIDHLVINRLLDFWLCESKHVSGGVKINEFGEFTAVQKGVPPRAMASPIEQNQRHVRILQRIIDSGAVTLPKRLGLTIRPNLRTVVLIANGQISRPKQPVAGIETVIKCESFRDHVNREADRGNPLELAKLVSQDTLRAVGEQLVSLHRPVAFDWEQRFRLAAETPPAAKPRPAAIASPPRREPTEPQARLAPTCQSCGDPLTRGVVQYCRKNTERFQGRLLCMPCQAKLPS